MTNVFDHGLTSLLSIFLPLIYLFIHLNQIIYLYIIMICKWSKIRMWFPFWLNINEIQPSKYITKNCNLIFLDSALFFEFWLSCCMRNKIYKIYCFIVYSMLYCILYIIYFIFHSLWSFIDILVGFLSFKS